jgi:hypothetical protein
MTKTWPLFWILPIVLGVPNTAFAINIVHHGMAISEVIVVFIELHNEELHNLYCSPSIIRIIKSRRVRWAGHVA